MIPNLNVVRQQSSTADKVRIQLVDTTGAPVSGVTPTLTMDKTQSGTYSAVSGAVSASDAKGVSWWTGNATDRNTLGPCSVYVTGTGAVSYTFTLTIVAYNPAAIADANNRVDLGKVNGDSGAAAGLAAAGVDYDANGYANAKVAGYDTGYSPIEAAGDIADTILGRTITGSADGGRTVRDALRFLRNKWTLSGGTLTVYAEDDTTVAWTATITSNPSAEPVTGSAPA